MASTYFMSSVNGFVSSKRRLQRAAELACDAEVEADGLRVADVQEAVGLRRETRGHRAAEAAGRDVVGDEFADEIATRGRIGGRRVSHVSLLGAEVESES